MDPNVIDLWTRRPIDPFALGWFGTPSDDKGEAEADHPAAPTGEPTPAAGAS